MIQVSKKELEEMKELLFLATSERERASYWVSRVLSVIGKINKLLESKDLQQ